MAYEISLDRAPLFSQPASGRL